MLKQGLDRRVGTGGIPWWSRSPQGPEQGVSDGTEVQARVQGVVEGGDQVIFEDEPVRGGQADAWQHQDGLIAPLEPGGLGR